MNDTKLNAALGIKNPDEWLHQGTKQNGRKISTLPTL